MAPPTDVDEEGNEGAGAAEPVVAASTKRSAENGEETLAKIDAFLQSRCSDRATAAAGEDADADADQETKLPQPKRMKVTAPGAAGAIVQEGTEMSQPTEPAKAAPIENVAEGNGDEDDDDDDDLLPPPFKVDRKNHQTPIGRIRSCMCPNPYDCRAIMLRWARLREQRYGHCQTFPRSAKPDTDTGRHVNAYRIASLRSLGYDASGPTIARTTRHFGTKEASIDRPFSTRICIVHFHPEVRPYVTEPGKKTDKWRIPIELGERIGLKEEDKCPTLDKDGNQNFFALPTYTMEEATAEVERAEEQYKQKVRDFRAQNKTLLSEMASNPSKFVMRIHELEQQNASLLNEVKELKEKRRQDSSQKRAAEKHTERLEKGLEKLARRMDKWESANKVGGMFSRDAKEIYREATGKDLSEEGFFNVEPTCQKPGPYVKGENRKGWVDPRMDRAVQVQWEDPTISGLEALRIGGYEFPPADQIGLERETVDSDGVTLRDRKDNLKRRIFRLKQKMAKDAVGDPKIAEEYALRYPEVAPPPPYGGLDLSGIPDQPLVRSAASNTGYRGVQKKHNSYVCTVGTGINGKKRVLGKFTSAEEAAGIYSRAKQYIKLYGVPRDWVETAGNDHSSDSE